MIYINTIYNNHDLKNDLNENIKVRTLYKNSKNSKIDWFKIRVYTFILKKLPPKILYKLFIREKCDIEIAFFRGVSVKIISGSNNKKAKKIAWVHNDFSKCTGIFDWFKKREDVIKAYNRFNKIVCVSEYAKEKFSETMGIYENEECKYNINICSDIIKKSKEDISELELSDDFTICTVGKLVEAKGYDRLLKVNKRLIDNKIKHNLLIIGDGPKEYELSEFIRVNKLEKTVKLLGLQYNPYKFMSKSDLFVCSSRWEGFSTVMSEAVILQVPILTTEVSGARELLGDNEYGIIVENEIEYLYKGLEDIITNYKLYEEYNEKVKLRGEFFETENAVKEIEKIL